MIERTERIAALSIALAVNLLVIAYLMQAMRPERMQVSEHEQVIQVIFLDKPRLRPKTVPATHRVDRTASGHSPAIPKPARRPSPTPAVASSEALVVVTAPANPPVEDEWGLARSVSDQTPEGMNFKPDPLRRRQAPIATSTNRMHLRMQDRSIGGMLQAMTKASICRELRRALSSSPASADAILASMEKYGCGKR